MKHGGNMIKKNIVFGILLVMGIRHLYAQTLTIRVENADIGKGDLMIGIFNDEKIFPNDYFRGEKLTVSNGIMTIVFNDLPKGQYAVSVYQDSNGNEQLDKNIFGIPKEKYGFSNNSNRPDFIKCLFDFYNDVTISIRLK
jgi:uncharacterized protein (DUF2141 family)